KFKDMRDLMVAMGGGKLRGRWKRMKGVRNLFGGGLEAAAGADQPMMGMGGPFGMPEVGRGKVVSRKALEKRRKKSKEAKKARKKARKR
ncbi:MAG: signal recognition particle protein, partial [Thermodesulfobacteriota bacterium]